jgi:hypothetical protein
VFIGASRADQEKLQVGEERLGCFSSQALVGDDSATNGWTVGRLDGQQPPDGLPFPISLGLARPNPVTVPSAVQITRSLTPQ